MNRWRFRVRLAALPLSLVGLLLLGPGKTSLADDRDALAKVIHAIPPNGPFWQYGNVVMGMRCRPVGMQPVIFPHWKHRAMYTCRVCHMELGFSMKQGDTGVTRSEYLRGKYCGVCHNGKAAFTVKGEPGSPNCERCHIKDTKGLEARFEEFAEGLPIAAFGNGIDWAKAIRDEQMAPRNTLNSRAVISQLPDKLKTPLKLGSYSDRTMVIFSHQDHFAELDCSSCHPDIFNIKKEGTRSFSMENNLYGNFCGACHLLVAFPMNDCKRCHPRISSLGA
ncbi:c(7)-type cytochrome triheme domain-containing protein [Geomesophilobacter sediminis]|uniref:Cytochrome c7-like domain-containing protein n=1 Tax=Geomesophilobacter sediminis TaxID=2798584 RepID=A0A8J7JGH7_9BACT|nr:c(7)-type cytochrome triheme domain-containing protein [Geomesophilobacter sediminis]MBJ6723600.1 hypothetical protein [Geomesophilobacter sediminis]